MKSIINFIQFPFHQITIIMMFASLGMLTTIYAQTEEEAAPETQEATTDTTATEDEEVIEKPTLRMSFEAFKINDQVKIMARVRSKVGTKWQNTAYIEVSFYIDESIEANLLGKDTSNAKGEASWMLPVPAESTTYVASVKDHPDFEDVEETITLNPSVLTMDLVEEDSMRLVKIFIGIPNDSGNITPASEVECKIYVQRLFGDMPLGEPETTDEEGNISVELPAGIPGDAAGNITIVAKVAEHELLGNVETSKSIAWGVPVVSEDFYSKRQLWSARANSPILLVVIVNAALLGIWGVIFYIFWQIVRINKIGKASKMEKG